MNLDITEKVTTTLFAFEIVFRYALFFPRLRKFFAEKSNCFDLFLVIATSLIQIPAIHNSNVYGWLTVFQILRMYRIIAAIPPTRDLLVFSTSQRVVNLLGQSAAQHSRSPEFNIVIIPAYVFVRNSSISVNQRRDSDGR